MKKKINYKKICLLLVVLIVSCFVLSSVEAAVTSNSGKVVDDNTSGLGSMVNTIMAVVGKIGAMAASGVFATITALINVLSISIFLALAALLASATGDYTHVPMPDTIVFNRFAFFDANFINPAKGSLIKGFGDILSDLFASFQTVAISVFIIAAMVTGVKLALSSVAAKKAQYKEAALKWITGFNRMGFRMENTWVFRYCCGKSCKEYRRKYHCINCWVCYNGTDTDYCWFIFKESFYVYSIRNNFSVDCCCRYNNVGYGKTIDNI